MSRICPKCNSTRLTKEGWKKLKGGNKQRWRCKNCNHGPFYKPKWTRGKKKDASKQPVEGSIVVLDDETED
jgi:transposase-like protein